MDENLLLDNKPKKLPILPILFLVLVLVSSGALYGYNTFVLGKANENISKNISSLESAIGKYKEDKKMVMNDLLEANKVEIEKYERNSDIVKYMDHLEAIKRKYGISFSGFSMNNGEIKTKVNAKKINIRGEKAPYEKVERFIRDYRSDENALLNLDFITSFEGMDNIEFDVNFVTKLIVEKTKDTENSKDEKTNLTDNSKTNE